jgi:hypothetical protein
MIAAHSGIRAGGSTGNMTARLFGQHLVDHAAIDDVAITPVPLGGLSRAPALTSCQDPRGSLPGKLIIS